MGQFDEAVNRQRMLLKAEEWAKGVESIHMHQLKSMWYETRPKDTDNGSVIDRRFNDGLIERTLPTGEIVYIGKQLKGDDLIYAFSRAAADSKE